MACALQIPKITAARSQLKTAIELWFADGDAVSIHTLACAAHQIIHDINIHQKGPDLIFDSAVIKDENRNEWVRRMKKEMNFFKHADTDPVGVIEFDPQSSELFILMSINGLLIFGLEGNVAETAFFRWFCLHNPDFLTDAGQKSLVERLPVNIEAVLQLEKQEFFEVFCANTPNPSVNTDASRRLRRTLGQ